MEQLGESFPVRALKRDSPDVSERVAPLLQDKQVKDVINQFQDKKGFILTRGQAEAVGYVLQHTGRIGVIQGDAGAGKSSSMEAVADLVKSMGQDLGVQVRGFTLQGKTSVMLQGDSGIESQTIDSFLNSKSTRDGKSRQIWVVDEYSMVDSRRLGALPVSPNLFPQTGLWPFVICFQASSALRHPASAVD